MILSIYNSYKKNNYICYFAGSELIASGLVPVQDNQRIVGGLPTNINHFPWQVSLLYYGNHRCGASIISENFIVTAAHCTHNIYATSLSVRAGTSLRNSGGVQIPVQRSYEHPQYNEKSIENDISVVRLSRSLNFGTTMRAIRLPAQNDAIQTGTHAWVTGWGETKESGSTPSYLQYISVPIVANNVCASAYTRHATITNNMICAGFYTVGGTDACQGDSGGPLVANNRLYGIVSFGIGCARPLYPGVYTRVSSYINWINAITSQK